MNRNFFCCALILACAMFGAAHAQKGPTEDTNEAQIARALAAGPDEI